MGKHSSSRWDLAPTLALGLIISCGVAGTVIGQSFVRPTVEFGSSSTSFAEGGGQAGAVERTVVPVDAPAPASGSRPAVAPTSAGRDRRSAPPSTSPPAREPIAEPTTDEPAADWLTRSPSHSPEPAPSATSTAPAPEQDQPRCGERSE